VKKINTNLTIAPIIRDIKLNDKSSKNLEISNPIVSSLAVNLFQGDNKVFNKISKEKK